MMIRNSIVTLLGICWSAMRIIAGSASVSRTLEAPTGLQLGPTSDRLRETLFNVLAPRIQGVAFLDLYAGSGAVGDRGAQPRPRREWSLSSRPPKALKALRGNWNALGLSAGFRIHASAVGAFLRRASEADAKQERHEVSSSIPPWDAAAEYAATLGLLAAPRPACSPPALWSLPEHRRKERLEDRYGSLEAPACSNRATRR